MQTILHKTRLKRAKKVCLNNHFLNNGKKIEIKNYNKVANEQDKKVPNQACQEFLILGGGKEIYSGIFTLILQVEVPK
jgi:hypothetical protein